MLCFFGVHLPALCILTLVRTNPTEDRSPSVSTVENQIRFDCVAFAACRAQFPWTSLLDSLPDCLICHGWPTLSKAWLDLLELFEAIPDRHDVIAWPVSPLPPLVDLFVDGACACPTSRRLRFASWAVTMAASGCQSLDHTVVAAGHLRGLIQSAYRAELTAMVMALRHVSRIDSKIRIWCDNAAVVRVVRKALAGDMGKNKGAHSDLVGQLVQLGALLQGRDIQIVKVTSHCSSLTGDPVEEWAFWHNSLVDELAGKVNFRRTEEFWTKWQLAADALKMQATVLKDIQAVILKVGRLSKLLGQGKAPQDTVRPAGADLPRPPEDAEVLESASSVAWSIPRNLEKRYLSLNLEWVHRWWCDIGLRQFRHSGPMVWVSGIQLYADFRIFSQFDGLLSPRHGVWFDSVASAGGRAKLGIASRTTMFLNVLGAYWKSHKFRVVHKLRRPHSGTLACWTMAYLLPWSLDRLRSIDAILYDSFGRQVTVPKELDAICEISGDLPI